MVLVNLSGVKGWPGLVFEMWVVGGLVLLQDGVV